MGKNIYIYIREGGGLVSVSIVSSLVDAGKEGC